MPHPENICSPKDLHPELKHNLCAQNIHYLVTIYKAEDLILPLISHLQCGILVLTGVKSDSMEQKIALTKQNIDVVMIALD